MSLSKQDMQKFFAAVRKHRTILLTAHVNPDPDAICSELAMAELLRRMGRRVVIVNDEALPERFRFLPGARMIRPFEQAQDIAFDAAIVLDSGDIKRIGRVAKLLTPDKFIINLDHHITSRLFGQLNLIQSDASSTAEIIFDLLRAGNIALDKATATLLYVGIMTDTGSFRYDNTSPHTHRATAELLSLGLSPASFYRHVYETIPLMDFHYFAKIVSRFEVLAEGRVICMALPQRTLRRFSAEFDLRDKLFRELRTIKGVEVVFILTEESRNFTKVNLRSHGNTDVAQVATVFGGGGHRKASGCQMGLPILKAKEKVLREILKALKH